MVGAVGAGKNFLVLGIEAEGALRMRESFCHVSVLRSQRRY
jgi:hypothetical protein